MKKNNYNRKKKVSAGTKLSHFLKHYFGYVLLALLCAVVTVVVLATSI